MFDKKIYIGNVYKVTKSISELEKEKTIQNEGIDYLVGGRGEIKISTSIEKTDEHYELYAQNVLMYKIDEHPLSSFIVFGIDKKIQKISSFPTGLNSLFVDIESIILLKNSEENKNMYSKLKKLIRKKNN